MANSRRVASVAFVVALSMCAWAVRDEVEPGQCWCKPTGGTKHVGFGLTAVDSAGVTGPAGKCCSADDCQSCSRYGIMCCGKNAENPSVPGTCGTKQVPTTPEWNAGWNHDEDKKAPKMCQCGSLGSFPKKELYKGGKREGKEMKPNCSCQPTSSCADCHTGCSDVAYVLPSSHKGKCCMEIDAYCALGGKMVKQRTFKSNNKCVTEGDVCNGKSCENNKCVTE